MQNAQARISSAVLASGTLHLLLCLCPTPRPPLRRVPLENHMDFEVVTIAPARPENAQIAAPPAEPPAARAPTRHERDPVLLARGAARFDPAAPQASQPAPAEPSAAEPKVAELAPAEGPANPVASVHESGPSAGARGLDLSPATAARTLSTSMPSTWSMPRADRLDAGADADVDRAAEARLAQAIPELSRKGDDVFDRTAEEGTWLIARPWEYILSPLRGARYQFQGVGFDAIIRGDGSVQYRDKSALRVMGGATSSQESRAGPIPPPTATFGLGFNTEALGKLFGHDAHKSERRRFLERTRALRELLHERSRRVALARADVHLSHSLKLIALELEAGDAHSARKRLFALWDECAEDEVGAIARKRIESFAREHCAEETGLGFEAAELLMLNKKRLSHRRFEPYALALDAGASDDSGP